MFLTIRIDEHKFLVELACGTALAPAYDRVLFDKIMPATPTERAEERVVVFVVCGGAKVDTEQMEGWRKEVRENGVYDEEKAWVDSEVTCIGNSQRIGIAV